MKKKKEVAIHYTDKRREQSFETKIKLKKHSLPRASIENLGTQVKEARYILPE